MKLRYLFCHLRHLEGIILAKLHFLPVISSAPQVSVTEYNKLQAEIRQLRSDLHVSNKYDIATVFPGLAIFNSTYQCPVKYLPGCLRMSVIVLSLGGKKR